MIALTLEEVASAVGGTLIGADSGCVVTGSVEYDSRAIGPGGLFVAIPGQRQDGHDYAEKACQAGAVAVMGTRVVNGVPMIIVDDAQSALGRLARAVIDQLPDVTVIGLTGSSGKTTTKDLLAGLLPMVGPTVAPPGSLNNELGLPYTVVKADRDTRFLVLEMGSRGLGHLEYLCQIAPPRIGVVINVGVAHIGEFGSVEAIATAKGELIEALPSHGFAILNADDPWVRDMGSRTQASVVLVGESEDAHIRAVDVTLDEQGRASYLLISDEGQVRVRLAVPGRHQVGNSLLVAATATTVGMPLHRIAEALTTTKLTSRRRMDVFDRPDEITVIDDSYNANPASMITALETLVTIGANRRTYAVLGYMAELGDREQAEHERVGQAAARLGVDCVVVVEEKARSISDGAALESSWEGRSVQVTDQAAAVALLLGELRSGDVVLVKGSRYRTWHIADALRVDGQGAEEAGV